MSTLPIMRVKVGTLNCVRSIKSVYFAGAGFTKESGELLLLNGGADAIVYGTKLLANPDLPERFKSDALLNEPDQATFYSPGDPGYTDYPTLEGTHSATV